MSDYCDCCNSNVEHIRQHYDPGGLTRGAENPAITLDLFKWCFPDCDLRLEDVEAYLDSLEEAPR